MKNIIENLRAAREIVSSAVPETVDLARYGTRTPCGTLFCALGHIAASPSFKEHIRLKWETFTQCDERVEVANVVNPEGSFLSDRVLDGLFGYDSFLRLFATREHGTWDHLWHGDGSDQDLALWRIDRQLELIGLFSHPEVEELVFGMGTGRHKLFVERSSIGRRSTLQVLQHEDVRMWNNQRAVFMKAGEAAAEALQLAGREVDVRVFKENRITTLELSVKEAA